MLRGIRWQVIALFVSIITFALVFVLRMNTTPEPTPTPQPSTSAVAEVTEAAPSTATVTPEPVQAATLEPLAATDEISDFVEGLVGTVGRLNPLFAALNPAEQDIVSLIYEGLTRINQYGEIVGDLAERWVVSRDGLEYVFVLREDILWQDGTTFTADDVLFTIHLLSADVFPGLEAQAAFWRTVEVQKVDDYTVRFRLAQPLASFPSLLTLGILPEHALSGTTAEQLITHPFNLSPIGTGAYQLDAIRSSDGQTIQAIDLVTAPTYQQRIEGEGNHALQHLRFRIFPTFEEASQALADGNIDGLAATNWEQRETLLGISGLTTYTTTSPSVGMLIFNWDEPEGVRFFSDQRVRTALQIGINRTTPIESNLLNRAVVANSPLLPISWAYDPDLAIPSTDTARARELLENANIQADDAEATEEPDTSGIFYSFSILTIDQPEITSIAQEIATQWSQLGLEVTVESVPFAEYQTRIEAGEFQTAIVELSLSIDPDVYAYWHSSQYPDGLNYGGAADSRIDEILERGRRDTNGLNRDQLYQEFQQNFVSRAIAIPLYYPLFTYAVRDEYSGVQLGFVGALADRFRTIQQWRRNADGL